MDAQLLVRYADLIVSVGANVQPDQVLAVEALPEAQPLVAAIARRAYEKGARYVDVQYFDGDVKRIRAESALDGTLDWVPPNEMTITAITGSQGGTCHLANNMLMCTGGKHKEGLAPPKCTCRHGGVMTVDFTATGDSPTFNGHWWTYYGIWSQTDITSMTPVPYQIPSYQNPQTNFADLPLCDPGTQSTDAHPCHVE